MANERKEVAVRARPIDINTVERMLMVPLRRKIAMASLAGHIDVRDFNETEQHLAMVWSVAKEHWEEHGKLPKYNSLLAELDQALSEDVRLGDVEKDLSREFVVDAFDGPVTDFDSKWALDTSKKFLRERLYRRAGEEFSKATVRSEIPAYLRDLSREAEIIETIGRKEELDVFPSDWDFKKVQMMPTCLEFIDHYMGGGPAADEVMGLLGPYGSCKTTLAVMAACLMSKSFRDEWGKNEDKPLKVFYLITYEATIDELRNRLLIYMAKIPRSRLMLLESDADMTRTGELQEYEKKMFAHLIAQGVDVPGEYERYDAAKRAINTNIRILDGSGSGENSFGAGMVPEAANQIATDIQQWNNLGLDKVPGFVMFDYVGAAAERFIAATNAGYNDLRHLIGKFPINCKNMIAAPFKIPVLLLHQLKAQINKSSPSYLPHHSDAAEAANFGENCDFCFNLGIPDDDGFCVFNCTKSRREGRRPHKILKIVGNEGRVIDTSTTHAIDSHTKRIVAMSDLNTVTEGEETTIDPAFFPNPSNIDVTR